MTTGRTTLAWWESVLADETKLITWLKNQYHAEYTAFTRIIAFADKYAPLLDTYLTLVQIASQEKQHAEMVAELLKTRGVTAELFERRSRYWEVTNPGVEDLETGAAIFAYAERLSLKRICVITEHPQTPDDIRAVYLRIYPEEQFHNQAFSHIAGKAAFAKTAHYDRAGREALGVAA